MLSLISKSTCVHVYTTCKHINADTYIHIHTHTQLLGGLHNISKSSIGSNWVVFLVLNPIPLGLEMHT